MVRALCILHGLAVVISLGVLGFEGRALVVAAIVALVGLAQILGTVWFEVYPRWHRRRVARQVARAMLDDIRVPRARIALAPDAHQVRAGEGAEADLGEELGKAHHRHVR
jgi:hypothetical protein